MRIPDATPPFPLETVADRRFVLRAQVVGCPLVAALLLALAIAGSSPKFAGYAAAAVLGAAQAYLALKNGPRRLRIVVRIALFVAFFGSMLILK